MALLLLEDTVLYIGSLPIDFAIGALMDSQARLTMAAASDSSASVRANHHDGPMKRIRSRCFCSSWPTHSRPVIGDGLSLSQDRRTCPLLRNSTGRVLYFTSETHVTGSEAPSDGTHPAYFRFRCAHQSSYPCPRCQLIARTSLDIGHTLFP